MCDTETKINFEDWNSHRWLEEARVARSNWSSEREFSFKMNNRLSFAAIGQLLISDIKCMLQGAKTVPSDHCGILMLHLNKNRKTLYRYFNRGYKCIRYIFPPSIFKHKSMISWPMKGWYSPAQRWNTQPFTGNLEPGFFNWYNDIERTLIVFYKMKIRNSATKWRGNKDTK